MEYYSAIRKNEVMDAQEHVCMLRNLYIGTPQGRGDHTKCSKSGKYHMTLFVCRV